MSHKIIQETENIFVEHSNNENAYFMKKYMKDKFEYFGIKTPVRRNLVKQFLTKSNLPDVIYLKEIIKELWTKPQREMQYFGMDLEERYIGTLDEKHVSLLEYMIKNKSWWDTVDFIAIKLVGKIFQNYTDLVIPVTEKWIASGNIWLQRSALLFQLNYKENTDTKLLFKYIISLSSSNEFFIRKAIGWALREYSKTSSDTVIQFVESNDLSPLSRKEALRLIK